MKRIVDEVDSTFSVLCVILQLAFGGIMNSHWMRLPLLLVVGWSATAFAASIAEMSEQAKEMVEEIQSISREVDALAVEAKQSNDSVLIQCVSTKQASVSALKDISVGALFGILQATTTEKAEFEFRKINVSLPRVRQFYNEAQKCVTGASSTSEDGTSDTQVIVSISNSSTNTFSAESDPEVSQSESYSFDSSNTSVDSGAESINPPPETSPY
jgi:hypothetical protein